MVEPSSQSGQAPDGGDEQAVGLLLQHLAEGGTLGDLRGLEANHYEALYAIGHNQYQLGHYDKAIEMFQFLVLMNPWDRRFPMALGSAYQMSQRYDKALGYYTMALSLNMMDPIPMFHSAECMAALGHYAQAAEALQFVIRNSKTAEHEPYKQRAQGILPLIEQQVQSQGAPAAGTAVSGGAEPAGGPGA
jgi:type III secretion system low calcium response chaperone LcrH/SycD